MPVNLAGLSRSQRFRLTTPKSSVFSPPTTRIITSAASSIFPKVTARNFQSTESPRPMSRSTTISKPFFENSFFTIMNRMPIQNLPVDLGEALADFYGAVQLIGNLQNLELQILVQCAGL